MQDKTSDIIRNFGMANQMAEVALDRIEKKYNIDLGRVRKSIDSVSETYVDFEKDIRKEAAEMAQHYELFYCLEVSIRKLINQRLQENYGVEWWNAKKADGNDVVPQAVRDYATLSKESELAQAITLRSDDLIDYISFGHLASIIVSNWDIFGDMFTKKEAVQRVLKLLNTLRSPIAHCCPLADHEIARLRLTVLDWFQIMS
ncbi:MAG: Swt1 family HEPN domain-containing protein [Acidimicrobiales bacterium]